MKKINNMWKEKKAQLAFFMILGFIILFVMGFVFYVNKESTGYKTKKETLSSQESTFDVTSVKSYVTSCLEHSTRKGIKLLGDQGGVIYSPQGGIDIALEFELGLDGVELEEYNEKVNVSYGIYFDGNYDCNTDIPCKNFSGTTIGNYPWIDFPSPSHRICNDISGKIKEGCFGSNTIYALTGPSSMYGQMELYINNTIMDCLDFSVFEDLGFEIKINGTMNVNVNTTRETVISTLKLPLIIIDPNNKKYTRVNDFYYDTRARLELMHEIATKLIEGDITNETYNVSEEIIKKDSLLSIDILRGDDIYSLYHGSLGNQYVSNIVRIKDTFSSPAFIFQFARQNRPPVLIVDKIGDLKVSKGQFDQNVFNDHINLSYYDPDEDNVTIYYYSAELGIKSGTRNPITNISPVTIDNMNCPNFEIKACVSDNHYIKHCDTPFDGNYEINAIDRSQDWEEIIFEIEGCPTP
jgi:hypothetical protein